MKPAALFAFILLLLIVLFHLSRLVFGIEMVFGGAPVPVWGSVLPMLVFLLGAVLLWREQHRQPATRRDGSAEG